MYRKANVEEVRPRETVMGQNRRVNNNSMFKPEPAGIGVGQRNINEPPRRMENLPKPPDTLAVHPPMVQLGQQPPNLVEINEIIT